MTDIAHFDNRAAAVEFAAGHWVETAKEAIDKRGRFCVALSGGSTPAAIYRLLASELYHRVDWSRVWLFWSDERALPPDHGDNNYHMAMEAGFNALPIPPEQVLRMKAEEDIEHHAEEYERLLKQHAGDSLDLMMLGMGEDGHTASLFPETEALKEEVKWVVPNFVPQLDCWRMTVTFPCIRAARQRVLYVLGENKRERLEAVLKGEGLYPVEHIGDALWVTDQPC